MKIFPLSWEKFNAKFSNNVELSFQNFTYVLFCKEFKIKNGIFAYKNQHYIETEPIDTKDGFITGFQSKYYGGREIRKNKSVFIDSLYGIHNKYKDLNRIIFYVKEISESTDKTKTKPDYIYEIEECGKKFGITVDWRVTSNFEIMIQNNSQLSDYYFNEQKGINDFIKDIEDRSKEYLKNIKNEIAFNDKLFKVPINIDEIRKFLDNENNVFIISGEAGVGKSGYVKSLYNEYFNGNYISIILDSQEIDKKSLYDICVYRYYEYNINDLIDFYSDCKNKVFTIDAVEKHKYFYNKNVLFNLIDKLVKNKWKVILTIRNEYLLYIKNEIAPLYKYENFGVEPVDKNLLRKLFIEYEIPIPTEKSILNLIRYPFYLNYYIKNCNLSNVNLCEFIHIIWDKFICKNQKPFNAENVKRKNLIFEIVNNLLNSEKNYHIDGKENGKIIDELINDGVIIYQNDNSDITFSHDILKEFSIYYFLESKNYRNNINCKFSTKERRVFNIYLEKSLLFTNGNDNSNWLKKLLKNDEVSKDIKNDILIKIINSSNQKSLNSFKSILIENKNKFLLKVLSLLKASSTDIDYDIVNYICINEKEENLISGLFRKPIGKAWYNLFSFIYDYKEEILFDDSLLNILFDILYIWVIKNRTGETTRVAGLIAMYVNENVRIENNNFRQKLNQIISHSAFELKDKIEPIIKKIINDNKYDYSVKYYDLLRDSILNLFTCGYIIDVFFEQMLIVIENIWFKNTSTSRNAFLLNNNIDNRPVSAFQTPIFHMLEIEPEKTIDFIIKVVNKGCTNFKNNIYIKRNLDIDVVEMMIDEKKMIQMCDKNLWLLHRGFVLESDILASILMALEYWLDNQLDNNRFELVNKYCKKLLNESNNVAITSVVLSVVEYKPKYLFEIANILITIKEIFYYDNLRIIKEKEGLYSYGFDKSKELYINERKKSNNKKFRKNSIENIIINYQLNSYGWDNDIYINNKERLRSTFNEIFNHIDEWDNKYKYPYYRINLQICNKNLLDDGNLIFKYNFPDNLKKESIKINKRNKKINELLKLYNWLVLKLEKKSNKLEKYSDFENDSLMYLEKIVNKEIICNHDELNFNIEMFVYALSILIRDYSKKISQNQYETYIEIFIKTFEEYVIKNKVNIIHDIEDLYFEVFIKILLQNPYNYEVINKTIELLCNSNIDLLENGQVAINTLYVNNPSLFNLIFSEIVYNICKRRTKIKRRITKRNLYYKKIISKLSQYYLFFMMKLKRLPNNKIIYINNILPYNCNDYKFLVKKILKFVIKDNVEYDYLVWIAKNIYYTMDVQKNELIDIISKSNNYKCFNIILKNIIYEENRVKNCTNFWNIWNYIFPYVVEHYKKMDHSVNDLIFGIKENLFIYTFSDGFDKNFLIHILKENGEEFFEKIINNIGDSFYVLYAISMVLFITKGELFNNTGIGIIYKLVGKVSIIDNHNSVIYKNTIYYIENYVNYYLNENFVNFKKGLDKNILKILDFLIDNGSSLGYTLRNRILDF